MNARHSPPDSPHCEVVAKEPHPNQILKASVPGSNPEKKFGQADHTLDNALTALDGNFTLDTAKHKAKSYFAEYLVLDAVIGNTDRHHENWGMLRQRHDLEWLQFLAPSFDHASSLGRELVDDRRASLLKRDRIGDYVEMGRGAIYWSSEDDRGPSPLELVRRATGAYPDLLRPALRKVDRLENEVDNLFRRMPNPNGWISPLAKEFAAAMIHYSIDQLREVQL